MYADDATLESPKLNLPAELLAEVSRRAAVPQGDFRVDGWKPSLLERLVELLGPRRPECDPRGAQLAGRLPAGGGPAPRAPRLSPSRFGGPPGGFHNLRGPGRLGRFPNPRRR